MDEIVKKKIIDLYLSGVGSTTIIKLVDGVTKRKVLKVLNENNLIKKNENEEYDSFLFDGNKYHTTWKCNKCLNSIPTYASTKYYLRRNLKNKNICKKCSLKLQHGEGNPFFQKEHSSESKEKISKAKNGIKTSDHMSTKKYRKLISELAKERWESGLMEDVRVKLSNLMKQRIANGEIKGYNRSKAEDEIIEILEKLGIEVIPNFRLESKIFDIYIPNFNLLIEYNGDYWHCNPIKFDENYLHTKKNKTAKEIWDYDTNKLDLAIKNGYTCEVIWEYDYKKNKDIIKNLINKYNKLT